MGIKIGDKVNWTNKKSPEQDRWQGVEVIGETFFNGAPQFRVRNQNGIEGLIRKDEVVLSARELTDYSDQELADKYRALRNEAATVAKTLQDRGFAAYIKRNQPGDTFMPLASVSDYVFKFTKSETIKTEV